MQLEIKSSPEHCEAIREIKQLLGLDQNLEIYHVNSDFLDYRGDTISIRSRSLMSIFFYLSHHVDTPKDHKTAGLVTITLNKDGSEFDWGKRREEAFPYPPKRKSTGHGFCRDTVSWSMVLPGGQ